jgi:hypothetical protein
MKTVSMLLFENMSSSCYVLLNAHIKSEPSQNVVITKLRTSVAAAQ